jgi:hypothetical protein
MGRRRGTFNPFLPFLANFTMSADELIEPIAAATPSRKKRTADGADAGVGSLR